MEKVERSQKTDKTEFYPTVKLEGRDLESLLADWQHYYNWERPHSAYHGKTIMDRYFVLSDETSYSDEIYPNYNPALERIQDANYKVDIELKRLKQCI